MNDLTSKVLANHLISTPADEWSDQDWVLTAILANQLQQSAWDTPKNMIVILELFDAVWKGWSDIAQKNQILSLEIIETLTNQMSEKIKNLIDDLKENEHEFDIELNSIPQFDEQDNYDDDDENLPF